MSDRWRVEVDAGTCIGSGLCRGTAPHVFTTGEDDSTVVTGDPVPADEGVLDAASVCPVEAITVTDTATGTVLAPED